MRILFTGGGTGGHFYPIISIAEELKSLAKDKRLLSLELFYMSPSPYDAGVLFEHGIEYRKNSAGKLRRSKSGMNFIRNFFDLFRTGWGIATSVVQVFHLYHDVVFGKGGDASFPALLAAKLLMIPVVIHESDSVPGKVNLWAGKFAVRVAVSYREAAERFAPEKVAYTGQPVRKEITVPIHEGARELLSLALRMAAGLANVVVSRAGSTIFEIAYWGAPSIIIPINEKVSHDQRSNAFAYGRSGAATVVEEMNLTPNILVSEIERLVNNQEVRFKMQTAAKVFYKPDAARLVAEEILKIALD